MKKTTTTTTAAETGKGKSARERLIETINAKIAETGRLPWDSGRVRSFYRPISLKTKHEYTGVNRAVLSAYGGHTREFVTFKNAKAMGGKVKKGEHGLPCVFYTPWNFTTKKPPTAGDDEDDDVGAVMKIYTIFDISQCEGIETTRKAITTNVAPIEEIETKVKRYLEAAGIELLHTVGTPCYLPSSHKIAMPSITDFKSPERYYAVIFHEMIHSTGAKLGRNMEGHKGSRPYCKEEVVAETGAMFLCQYFGIATDKGETNSATYIDGWSKELKANPNWFIDGASAADKAADYIISIMEGSADTGEAITAPTMQTAIAARALPDEGKKIETAQDSPVQLSLF